MFGLRYMKAPPTDYVLHYKSGALKKEGLGLSFLYFAPTSTIVVVPVGSVDLPFVFNESTVDFQTVTIQGQLTYRILEARRLASMMDFSLRSDGKYASDDPQKLSDRLVQIAQTLTRTAVEKHPLRDVLTRAEQIGTEVSAAIKNADVTEMLGIEILALSVLSVRPTPDMARALEADAREQLLRKADEAIYARRNAAVEQERIIKENELNTQIAVETKQRQIRETRVAADIAVEDQRKELIALESANQRTMADAKAYALETSLKPLRDLDWKLLMALGGAGADPALNIGLAFRELAENAQKIGELNISPDLLSSLMKGSKTGK